MLRLKIEGKVPVVFFKEDEMVIAYSSVLDLSTCGETIKDAKKNFVECLRIYLTETVRYGTLEKDLLRLGWKSQPKSLTIIPPVEKYKIAPLHILKRVEIPIPVTA